MTNLIRKFYANGKKTLKNRPKVFPHNVNNLKRKRDATEEYVHPVKIRKTLSKHGYCENCDAYFDSYAEHIKLESHRKWEKQDYNFATIDNLIFKIQRIVRQIPPLPAEPSETSELASDDCIFDFLDNEDGSYAPSPSLGQDLRDESPTVESADVVSVHRSTSPVGSSSTAEGVDLQKSPSKMRMPGKVSNKVTADFDDVNVQDMLEKENQIDNCVDDGSLRGDTNSPASSSTARGVVDLFRMGITHSRLRQSVARSRGLRRII
ncbi:hypothetical protein BC829DRAFT_289364 [Chytridium lagenaria]|nr:hypothetical protein BC829DRAFT_289364 [Chytridium lagenaria]